VTVGSALLLSRFLHRARFGVAIRAVADDPDAARLAGVRPNAVSQFNWAIGATLAGVAGVLVAPLQLLSVGTFPLLLSKALVATLIGGLVSLPLAFAGGIALGVVESISILESSVPGASDLVILVLVAAVLVFRRKWPTVAASAAPTGHSIPRFTVPTRFRWALVTIALAGVAAAVIIPAGSTYWSFIGGRAMFFAIECLAIVVVSGWGGQVSLMQAAYAGIGAFGTAYLVVERGWALGPSLLVASVAGMLIGGLVGIPALRLSGPQFAVASLAFAGAASGWLFKRTEFPRSMPRGDLFGFDLSSDTRVYFVMAGVAAALFIMAWGVRRSTHGTLVFASRDAPDTVSHFGVSAAKVRMGVFMLSSFMSTLGGGLYAVLVTGLSPSDFSLLLSLSLVMYTVVGGMRSLLGPVIAAVLFGVLPQVVQGQSGATPSSVPDIVAGLVVVALIASRPAGVASFLPTRLFSPRRLLEPAPFAILSRPAPTQAGIRAFVHRHPYHYGGQSARQQ
jgi:branched-chain amino acid transport system permease protein